MKNVVLVIALILMCEGVACGESLREDSVKLVSGVKKAGPRLTKEEKRIEKARLKELNAIVKSAKKRMTKEEKARITKLSILEQDLRNWLEDINATWFNYGQIPMAIIDKGAIAEGSYSIIELGKEKLPKKVKTPGEKPGEKTDADFSEIERSTGTLQGDLYIKRGADIRARMFFRGVTYECRRVYYIPGYSWHFRDEHMRDYYFNIPGCDNEGVGHTEYKNYNPWEYLIELDKKNGKIPLKSK